MVILQQPDSVSLAGNIKDFIINSDSDLHFTLSVDGEICVDEMYTPVGGKITIAVKNLVNRYLRLFIPDYGQQVTDQAEAIKIFTASIGTDVINFTVIKGGIDGNIDCVSFLAGNFLTWQEQQKSILLRQPEWLAYYAHTACKLVIKAYFTDHTSSTHEIALPAGKVSTINTSYDIVNNLFPSVVSYYDIWVEGSGSRLTYIQRYVPIPEQDNSDIYIFENSLGGLDSFVCTGKLTEKISTEGTLTTQSEVTTDSSVDLSVSFEQKGFFRSRDEAKWLRDFFVSEQRYRITEDGLRKIYIADQENKFTISELNSFNFEFYYCDQTVYNKVIRNRDSLPELLEFPSPDDLFFLTPRLSEYPVTDYAEDLMLPVQHPYSGKWMHILISALKSGVGLIRTLGELENVTVEADKVSDTDRILVQSAGSEFWQTKLLSDVTNIDLEALKEQFAALGTPMKNGQAIVWDDVLKVIKTVAQVPDAILWNKQEFSSWLDQPIRTTDDVQFANVAAHKVTADELGSAAFMSGLLGTGFRLKDSHLELDELTVRKVMNVYELLIQQVRAIGGQFVISPANQKILKVEEVPDGYKCFFDTAGGTVPNPFVLDDQLLCQTFTGNIKRYWRKVILTGADYFVLSKTDAEEGSTVPRAGDEVVLLGNRTDTARQSALLLNSYGNDAPYLSAYAGINGYDLSGKEPVRVGNLSGIVDQTFGQLKGYGLFADHVYIKGQFSFNSGKVIEEELGRVEDKTDEAQQAATEAVTNALEAGRKAASALSSISEISSDNIVSPVEKSALKKEWDIIVSERLKIKAQGTAYGVSTTAYDNAYNALSALIRTNLDDLSTNWNISGATLRSTFKAYYDARTDLLNLIAKVTKDKADKAETDAGNAQDAADQARTEAANAKNAAAEAHAAATDAMEEAVKTTGRLDEWSSDSIISPPEKTALKQQQSDIQAEYNDISAQVTKYALTGNSAWTAYRSAYSSANAALIKYTAATPENIPVTSDFANIAAYYPKRQAVLSAISTAAKTLADAAQQAADEADRKAQEAQQAIENLEIGGQNLLDDTDRIYPNSREYTGIKVPVKIFEVGKTYTYSFDLKIEGTFPPPNTLVYNQIWGGIAQQGIFITYPRPTQEWKRFSVTFQWKAAVAENPGTLLEIGTYCIYDSGSIPRVRHPKIELGQKATDWTPSLSDTKKLISDAQDAADNANAAIAVMNDDSVFDIKEKQSIRTQWENINGVANTTGTGTSGSYYKTKSLGAGLSQLSALTTAYTNLRTYLNGLALYTDSNIGNFSRATMAQKFTAYYDAEIALNNAIADKIAGDKVADIQIGGRNLISNSDFSTTDISMYSKSANSIYTITRENGMLKIVGSKTSNGNGEDNIIYVNTLKPNEDGDYTISFDGYALAPTTWYYRFGFFGAAENMARIEVGTTKKRYSATFKGGRYNDTYSTSVMWFNTATTLYIDNIKLEKGNKATAWSPAIEDVQKAVEAADTKAAQAKADAKTANDTLNSWKADGVISPLEKQAIKETQAAVLAEKNEIVAEAAKYSVSSTAYVTAWTNYNTQLANHSKASPENITIAAALTTTQTAYSSAKVAIRQAIADAARTYVNSVGNSAKEEADWKALGQSWGNGKMLYSDPAFKTGLNSLLVYNNSNNGNVALTQIAKLNDSPIDDSGYNVRIRNTGAASPGLGGFIILVTSRANAVFVIRFIAKIPTGYSLNFAMNAMGNERVARFATSRLGTGRFQEYIYVIKCGATGSFSTGGHTYLEGTPGTSAAPVDWYLAYVNAFDITNTMGPHTEIKELTKTVSNINVETGNIKLSVSQVSTKVDTAKQEAITTAAADATTKANNAKTQAISAAATDATTKANNAKTQAKQEAVTAANTYTNSRTETMWKGWIDASALDSNKYYPVVIPLDRGLRATIRVEVSLNSGTKPSWSTHDLGFSVRCIWEASASNWGSTAVNRIIQDFHYGFATVLPVGDINQMTSSSNEYIYVRGGGKYYFVTINTGTPVLKTTSFTASSQTIDIKTSVVAPVVTNATKTELNSQVSIVKDLINLKVDKNTYDANNQSITSQLGNLNVSHNAISLQVSDINSRLGMVERAGFITTSQGNEMFASKTLENGSEIISKINQTAGSVAIKANRINLEGAVIIGTGGNEVRISNGKLIAKNAEISGKITADTGRIGKFTFDTTRIGTVATGSGGGGGLSIYDDLFRVGSSLAYVLFGNNVVPASSGAAFKATGRIVNNHPNVDPYGFDRANYGLIIDVSGAKKNYGVDSNAPLKAPAFIDTKVGLLNISGSGYTIDFSQRSVFLMYATSSYGINLPSESSVAQYFSVNNLPSDFGHVFTLIVRDNSKAITVNGVYDNDHVLRNLRMEEGDVMVLLVTKYPVFHYKVLSRYH